VRTATYVAVLFWILAGIFYSGYMHMGMTSAGLWWSFAFFGLVNFLLSAWAGAKVYSEDVGE
jgi:hypothetical protein